MFQKEVIGKVFRMRDRSAWRRKGMKKQDAVLGQRPGKNRYFRFLVGLACLGHFSCAAPWPEMAVLVVMPELPTQWSGADGWELDWRSMTMVGQVSLAAPGETLCLFLPRTSSAAIRCRPVFGSSRGHPYGAIWPLAIEPAGGRAGVLRLEPGGGFAAELAFRLYQGGWDAGNFNLRRFAMEAVSRMADPWDSDLSVLARAVAEDRFRADYLKTPGTILVTVSGLSGVMASDSPWGRSITPDAQGLAILAASPGIHRWFGYNQELVVSVFSDGSSSEWILRGIGGRLMQKVLP